MRLQMEYDKMMSGYQVTNFEYSEPIMSNGKFRSVNDFLGSNYGSATVLIK